MAGVRQPFGVLVALAFACSLGAATTLQLRKASPGLAPGSAPASAPSAAPSPSAPGAASCGCFRKPTCTCAASLEYLKCVTKQCAEGCEECSNTDGFANQCGLIEQDCSEALTFKCGVNETTCEGKFHQASDGIMGLTLQTDHLTDNAYCGPFGRCSGELDVGATILKPQPNTFLRCDIPRAGLNCHEPLTAGQVKSSCKMKMPALVKPGLKIEGRCFVSDASTGGKKLTKNAWFSVENNHKEVAGQSDHQAQHHAEAHAEAHAVTHSGAMSATLPGLLALGASLVAVSPLIAA